MSNYLETLVEKMIADGVSEQDIKSVIKEVSNKKSPLNQTVSLPSSTSSQDVEIGTSIDTDEVITPSRETVSPEISTEKEVSDQEKCEKSGMCWDGRFSTYEQNCVQCEEDVEEESAETDCEEPIDGCPENTLWSDFECECVEKSKVEICESQEDMCWDYVEQNCVSCDSLIEDYSGIYDEDKDKDDEVVVKEEKEDEEFSVSLEDKLLSYDENIEPSDLSEKNEKNVNRLTLSSINENLLGLLNGEPQNDIFSSEELEELNGELVDPVVLYKHKLDNGKVAVYSNTSLGTKQEVVVDENNNLVTQKNPYVTQGKNQTDSWITAKETGSFIQFPNSQTADAFINVQTNRWNLGKYNSELTGKSKPTSTAQNYYVQVAPNFYPLSIDEIVDKKTRVKYEDELGINLWEDFEPRVSESELQAIMGFGLSAYQYADETYLKMKAQQPHIITFYWHARAIEYQWNNLHVDGDPSKGVLDLYKNSMTWENLRHLMDSVNLIKGIFLHEKIKNIYDITDLNEKLKDKINILQTEIIKGSKLYLNNPESKSTKKQRNVIQSRMDDIMKGYGWTDLWAIDGSIATVKTGGPSSDAGYTFKIDSGPLAGDEIDLTFHPDVLSNYASKREYLFPQVYKRSFYFRQDDTSDVRIQSDIKFLKKQMKTYIKRCKKSGGDHYISAGSKINPKAALISYGNLEEFFSGEDYLLENRVSTHKLSGNKSTRGMNERNIVLQYRYQLEEGYLTGWQEYYEEWLKKIKNNRYKIVNLSGNEVFWKGKEVLNVLDGLKKYFEDPAVEELLNKIEEKHEHFVKNSSPAAKIAYDKYKKLELKLQKEISKELWMYKNIPLHWTTEDGEKITKGGPSVNAFPVYPSPNQIENKKIELATILTSKLNNALTSYLNDPDVIENTELIEFFNSDRIQTFLKTHDKNVHFYQQIQNNHAFWSDLERLGSVEEGLDMQVDLVRLIGSQLQESMEILDDRQETKAQVYRDLLGDNAVSDWVTTWILKPVIGGIFNEGLGGIQQWVFDPIYFSLSKTFDPSNSDVYDLEAQILYEFQENHGVWSIFDDFAPIISNPMTKFERMERAINNVSDVWIGKDGKKYQTFFQSNGSIIGHFYADSQDAVSLRDANSQGLDEQVTSKIKANEIDIDWNDFSWRGTWQTFVPQIIKMYMYSQLAGGGGGPLTARVKIGGFTKNFDAGLGLLYAGEVYNESYHSYLAANPGVDPNEARRYAAASGLITFCVSQISPESMWMKNGGKSVWNGLAQMMSKGEVSKKTMAAWIVKNITSNVTGEEIEEIIELYMHSVKDRVRDDLLETKIQGGTRENMYQAPKTQEILETVVVTAFAAGGHTLLSTSNPFKSDELSFAITQILQSGDMDGFIKRVEALKKKGKLSKEQAKKLTDILQAAQQFWNSDKDKTEFHKLSDMEKVFAVHLYTAKIVLENELEADPNNKELQEKVKENKESIESFESGEQLLDGIPDVQFYRIYERAIKYIDFSGVGGQNWSLADKILYIKELQKSKLEGTTLSGADLLLLSKNDALVKDIKDRRNEQLEKEVDERLKDPKYSIQNPTKYDRNKVKRDIILREYNLYNSQVQDNKRKELHFAEINKLKKDGKTISSGSFILNASNINNEDIDAACQTTNQIESLQNARNIIKIAQSKGIDVNIVLHFDDNSFNNIDSDKATNSDGLKITKGDKTTLHIRLNSNNINQLATSTVVLHEGYHLIVDSLDPDIAKKLKESLMQYMEADPAFEPILRFAKEQYARDGDETILDEAVVEFLARVTSKNEGDNNYQFNVTQKSKILLAMKKFWNHVAGPLGYKFNTAEMDFDEAMMLANQLINNTRKGKSVKEMTKTSVEVEKAFKTDRGLKINQLYSEGFLNNVDEIVRLLELNIKDAAKKPRISKKTGNTFTIAGNQNYDEQIFVGLVMTGNNEGVRGVWEFLWGDKEFDALKTYTRDANGNPDFEAYINAMIDARMWEAAKYLYQLTPEGIIVPIGPDGKEKEIVDPESTEYKIEQNENLKNEEALLNTTPISNDIKTEKIEIVNAEGELETIENGLNKKINNIIDGEVEYIDFAKNEINRILREDLPLMQEKGGKNDRTTPFVRAISLELGKRFQGETQQLFGKTNQEFKNFLETNARMLLANLDVTYLSKNMPQLVEKYVNGIGWTTDWQGRKIGTKPGQIARYGTADGPAYAGMTSGPQKMRVIKNIKLNQLKKIILDTYMPNGKQKQSKKEKLALALGKQIGLEILHDQLRKGKHLQDEIKSLKKAKNKKNHKGEYILDEKQRLELGKEIDKLEDQLKNEFPISVTFEDTYKNSNEILQDNYVVTLMDNVERGNIKQHKAIRNLDPLQSEVFWTELYNIGEELSVKNLKGDDGFNKVKDTIEKYINKGVHKGLFTETEINDIAEAVWKVVKQYHDLDVVVKDMEGLDQFIYSELENKNLEQTMAEVLSLYDVNGNLIKLSQSFDQLERIKTQRTIPIDYAKDMLKIGKSKEDIVIELLKYQKAQYSQSSKIGRGGMFTVHPNGTVTLTNPDAKGTMRYQSFESVKDFVDNVLNKIDPRVVDVDGNVTYEGIFVEYKESTRKVKGKNVKVYEISSVSIDGNEMSLDEISGFAQTTNNLRKKGPDLSAQDAKGAQESMLSLLQWTADQIEKGNLDKQDWGMLMMSLKSNMNTVLRRSANFLYDHNGEIKSNDDTLEHMIPAEVMIHILTDKYLNSDTQLTDELFDQILEDYNVALIPGEMDDLVNLNHQFSMPLDFVPGVSKNHARYYNKYTMGKDGLVTITNLKTGEIVGEIYVNTSADIDLISKEQRKLKPELVITEKQSKTIEREFLEILSLKKGIDPNNLPTALQAEINASKMWSFSLFPPSSYAFRDFLYKFLPKGKEGEKALIWLDEHLTKPYQEGVLEFKIAKQKLQKRYKELLKGLPKPKRKLSNKIGDSVFTYDQAVRVYIWSKLNGYTIPGMTSGELELLINTVENDPDLKGFAIGLNSVTLKNYPKPKKDWVVGNISSDISEASSASRAKFIQEWKKNVDLIFTEDVRNTLLNTYGKKFMAAFDNMLYAMEYGTSKPTNESVITRRFRNWINNSVGAIMFLNMRSAVLQTISTLNFIDWRNNNPAKAAARFADQKQWWADWITLFNSEHFQSRLGGDARGVTESEISQAMHGAKTPGEKVNAIIAWVLKQGFVLTRAGDLVGYNNPSFYRNQINFYLEGGGFDNNGKYIKDKPINPKTNKPYTLKQAEAQALLDWIAKAEESQQSSDPSQISEIQRSNLGILLLSFKNTPMQYARIMLRAADDIKNNRGNKLENLGKIAYYGLLQNFIFTFLQQAVWAAIGDDDEEEATDDMLQSMIDNVISGLGLEGQIVVTVKNGILEYMAQEQKGWNADHTYTVLEFLNLSPSIGSKFRKLYSAIKTRQINRDVMEKMGFEPGNPAVSAVADLISAFTNIPTDRAVRKVNNILAASSDEYEAHERIALLLGWNPWDLGLKTEKDYVRERIKKEKEEKKNQESKNEAIDAIKPTVDNEIEQYDKDKEDGIIEFDEDGYPTNKNYYCSGVNSKNIRCGSTVKKPGDRCEWHEDKDKDGISDYKQEDSKFKQQCDFIKKDNTRCKNTATGDNGRCNVRQHQPDYKE